MAFGIDDVIGGVIAGGSALLGGSAKGAANDEAKRQIEEAVRGLIEIGIPPAEARQIALEKYQLQGQLTPELEQAILAPESEAAQVETDPRFQEAEMEALAEMSRIGEEGGMTLTDKANIEGALEKARMQERGAREAGLSSVRARGQLGSGLELSAINDANQAAVNQAHEDALRVAGTAEDRALQSIMQSGKLAGEMDERQFGHDFKKASAADEIAKFNTQTRQRAQASNVDRENEAMGKNLQARQSVADRNVDLANKQEIYNTETRRQAAQDELDRAKAIAAARTGQAQQTRDVGKDTADMISNIGSGAVKLFGSAKDSAPAQQKQVLITGGDEDEEKRYA